MPVNLRFGNSVLVIVEELAIGGNGALGLKIILGRDVSVNVKFGNSLLVAEVLAVVLQGVPYGCCGKLYNIIVVVVDPSEDWKSCISSSSTLF